MRRTLADSGISACSSSLELGDGNPAADASAFSWLEDFLPSDIATKYKYYLNTQSRILRSHEPSFQQNTGLRRASHLQFLLAIGIRGCEVYDIWRSKGVKSFLEVKHNDFFLRECPVFERIYREWEFHGLP